MSIRDLVQPEPELFTGTPWHAKRFIAFDLETTAPDPETARIVTAAVVEVGAGEPTTSRTWLVDPGVEIPSEAIEVHGITTAHAREHGEPVDQALPAIIDHLAARPDGCPIVIFRAPYDLTVADRECRRHGIVPLQDRGELLVVDPLVIDKHLWRFRPGSRKLTDMCATYNVVLDAAHDASFDALAAARLAYRLARNAHAVRRHPWEAHPIQGEWERVRDDPRALHAYQIEQAAFQARGLRAHFQSVPEKRHLAAEVSEAWPIVPVTT